MQRTVGIIGLGIMGGAMARNLNAAGWHVVGTDIDKAICADLAKAGVEIAPNAAAVAAKASDIMTSLPNPKAVVAVAKEIAGSGAAKRTVIEASTLALEDKLAFASILEAAGHIPLDCTLSGTGAQAKVKDLVVYASGDSASIARLRPMFADIGRLTHDLGVFGNGSRMKYVANLLVAIHNVASAEAMVLGIKAGLDPHKIVEVIASSAGTSRIFELRAPMMADNEYEPATMRIKMWQKDMAVIGAYATELGVPTPTFSATLPVYAAAMGLGRGPEDTGAVCAVLEAMAGVKR